MSPIQKPLALLLVLATSACARSVSITQAYAACRDSGKDTSDVKFEAWFITEGWGLHVSERPPEPTTKRRFTVSADFGRETPLRGFPVRVEDDHGVLPAPTQRYMEHMTLDGTFVCKDRTTKVNVLTGHFVPANIVLDKKTINDE